LSTILKALRRLEEEKAVTEEARPLREQIASAPRGAQRPRRSGWLAAAGALVLGAATGGALIWSLFGTPAPAPVVAAAPVAPPAPAVAVPEPPVAPGPPEDAFASDVQMVERPDALPLVADSEPVQPGPSEPKPGQVRPVESSAAAERARQAALAEYAAAARARRGLPPENAQPSPPVPAEPVPVLPAPEQIAAAPEAVAPAPVAAPVAPAPPQPAPIVPAPANEIVAAQPAPKPAPPVEKKQPAAKPAAAKRAAEPAPPPPAAVPRIAVSVEKTQWHPLADRRIAWVRVPGDPDALRVVEGDVVDGLLISAIEPSGVVFERDGEKIRRPLGR
jgi:hypothetical protein